MKAVLFVCIFGLISQCYGKIKEDQSLIEKLLDALESSDSEDDIPEKRVIGGYELRHGQRPWLALLKGSVPTRKFLGITVSRRTFHCGASILNDRWLITAAHCFDGEAGEPGRWEARMGDVDKESGLIEGATSWLGGVIGKEDWKVWEVDVEKIIKHPNYETLIGDWRYDVALVKLKESVPVEDTSIPEIQAVPLPPDGERAWPQDGTDCYLAGWGCTETGETVSDEAREVRMNIVNTNMCKYMWDRDMSHRVCAGPENLADKIGMCKGDSGAPLMCMRGGRLVQAGIASYTSYDKPGQYPEIYSRIGDYVSWIHGTVSDNK